MFWKKIRRLFLMADGSSIDGNFQPLSYPEHEEFRNSPWFFHSFWTFSFKMRNSEHGENHVSGSVLLFALSQKRFQHDSSNPASIQAQDLHTKLYPQLLQVFLRLSHFAHISVVYKTTASFFVSKRNGIIFTFSLFSLKLFVSKIMSSLLCVEIE